MRWQGYKGTLLGILRHSCLSDSPIRIRGGGGREAISDDKHTQLAATQTVANKQKSTTTTIGKHANDCNSCCCCCCLCHCCCCCCGSYYGHCCAETRERAIKMRGQSSQTYVVTREKSLPRRRETRKNPPKYTQALPYS